VNLNTKINSKPLTILPNNFSLLIRKQNLIISQLQRFVNQFHPTLFFSSFWQSFFPIETGVTKSSSLLFILPPFKIKIKTMPTFSTSMVFQSF
jgi:hypothetical protein